MFLTYNSEREWEYKDLINEDDYVVATIDHASGADDSITGALLARCYPRAGTDCILWAAGSYGGASNRKPTPYFLPHRADMRYAVPARQMILASHLNIDHHRMPSFRISMLCTTYRCVNIHHMMPESFRARAAMIRDLTPAVSQPVTESLQEDYQIAAAEIRDRLDTPTKPRISIEDLIKSADTSRKKND